MKPSSVTISLAFLFVSLFAHGQTDEPAKQIRRRPITKGYYSISNSSPVAGAGTRLAADTGIAGRVAKGYLSVSSAVFNIRLTPGWLLPKQKRPVITKGYYSIGDHLHRFPGAIKR